MKVRELIELLELEAREDEVLVKVDSIQTRRIRSIAWWKDNVVVILLKTKNEP